MNKDILKRITAIIAGILTYPAMIAYALPPISPNVTAKDFDNLTIGNVTGWIVGFILWVLRIAGFLGVIWGIYGYVVSKKDGEADGMNIGILKFGIGLVLMCLPAVLIKLGVITHP